MAIDFSLSDVDKELRARARAAFAPLGARARQPAEGPRADPVRDVWDALAAWGFFGCIIPPAYGGTGMGLLGMCHALEELGAVGLGNMQPILTAVAIACIERNGSEDLKRRYLPRLAKGELRFAFAATEADAGFNLFNIATRAERQGDEYVIHGSKTYISGADLADCMLLVTRTKTPEECKKLGLPRAFGMTLFVVGARSEGITMTRLPLRGETGLSQFSLGFDGLRVPAADVIGQEDGGSLALFNSANPERILVSALTVGFAQYCLDVACAHARERKVFGNTPIGSYQAIQHPLAEVRIRQEAVRQMVYRAAWAFHNQLPPNEVGYLANCAKYLAAELGVKAADAAIDALGGKGFNEEYGIIQLWDSMRLLKTSPISDGLILSNIALHDLKLPRSY